MRFSDILDLARQGYKPSDIRELLSMDTETKSEPDYKKMYEDALKRIDALQKANQRKPVEEHKDTVNDIIRDVFY